MQVLPMEKMPVWREECFRNFERRGICRYSEKIVYDVMTVMTCDGMGISMHLDTDMGMFIGLEVYEAYTALLKSVNLDCESVFENKFPVLRPRRHCALLL